VYNRYKKLSEEDFEQYKNEISRISSIFGITISSSEWRPKNRGIGVKYDISDLPSDYKELFDISESNHIGLVFVYSNIPERFKKSYAGYDSETDSIIINMNQVPKDIKSSDIWKLIEKYSSDIQHELTHMVQYRAFSKVDPKQLYKKQGYHTNKQDYYSSPAEFEAMIKTAEQHFRDLIDDTKKRFGGKYSNRKLFDAFVGVSLNRDITDNFFLALKNTSEKRWKLAVKKLQFEVLNILKEN
jgi:hypothetical protein